MGLSKSQKRYAQSLSRRTGLLPRVIGAWELAEGHKGDTNYLNIGWTDKGRTKDSRHGFGSPRQGAKTTAFWIRHKADPRIRAILKTAGKNPGKQIRAIYTSPWASGHYNGGSLLRGTYKSLGGMSNKAGAPARGRPRARTVSKTTTVGQPQTNMAARTSLLQDFAMSGRHDSNALLNLAAGLKGASVSTPAPSVTTRTASSRVKGVKPIKRGGGGGHGSYPLSRAGKVIGVPYKGTHTDFGNWESDNAVDIAAKKGTPVRATTSGVIGSQIGALGSGSSQLAGLRLHLSGKHNEYYYAHLSKLKVHAGQRVHKGQVIGYSGVANGVSHLHFASKHGDPRHRLKRKH